MAGVKRHRSIIAAQVIRLPPPSIFHLLVSGCLLIDYSSIEEVNRSVRMQLVPRIVRDHADRRAVPMEFL